MSLTTRGSRQMHCDGSAVNNGSLGLTVLLAVTLGAPAGGTAQRPTASPARRPVLQLTPVTRIAAADHDLSTIARVTRGSSGTIYVSQPQDGNIITFSSAGQRLGVLGRKGAGPGEFEAVHSMREVEGGLVVYDFMRQRITSFDPDGKHRTTQPITMPAKLPAGGMVVAANSRHVVWANYPRPPRSASDGATTPRSVGFHVALPDGGGVREWVTFARISCSLQVERDRGVYGVGIPYCHDAMHALSPDMAYIAIATPVNRQRASTGFDLLVISSRGDTVTRSRHILGPSMIPDRLRDSVIAAFKARNYEPGLVREIIGGNLIPRSFPPISELNVSDQGDVWITTRSGPEGSRGILVVRSGGREAGYATLPRLSSVRWVGGNDALIVEEDADGLQDLVLYRARPQ